MTLDSIIFILEYIIVNFIKSNNINLYNIFSEEKLFFCLLFLQ